MSADASVESVIDRLDLLLEPYGGLGAYGRDDQISHRFLNEEFEQLRQTSGLFSAVFLAVTAASSYAAMNFTGSTPFTSPSGVEKEMRGALPFQLGAGLAAVLLFIAQLLVNLLG